jgi:hypothetical protein
MGHGGQNVTQASPAPEQRSQAKAKAVASKEAWTDVLTINGMEYDVTQLM